LTGWEPLIDPMYYPQNHAQAVILSCTVGLGGRKAPQGSRWYNDKQLDKAFSHEDVVKYSGLELMLTHSKVGLSKRKTAVVRCGDGRGRALAVIARWTLVGKFELRRAEAAARNELDARSIKWLKDFPTDKAKHCNHFYEQMDAVEHLKREKVKGVWKMKKQPWARETAVIPGDTNEEQRCVISHIRGAYVNMVIGARKGCFRKLKSPVIGVLQKTLLLHRGDDLSVAEGWSIGFADPNQKTIGRPELTEAALLKIPETVVVVDITDAAELAAAEEKADIANIAMLKEVSNRWKRYHVDLSYWITVKEVKEDLRFKKRSRSDFEDEMTSSHPCYSGVSVSTAAMFGSQDSDASLSPAQSQVLSVYKDFLAKHPECDLNKVYQEFPAPPTRPELKTKCVSLHKLAAEMLAEYTKMGTVEAFLRAGKHSLQAIHAVAMGISAVIRIELNQTTLDIERRACGIVRGRTSEQYPEQVSVFNGQRASEVPQFAPGEEAKIFSMDYKDYAAEKLDEDRKLGKFKADGEPAVHEPVAVESQVCATNATTCFDL